MSLSINTNLSSLIVQANILESTLGLNSAIERMTTGFKVNHAKDNAANFGIITNLNTQIGSLTVAEDNALMSLDFISNLSSNMDLITEHLSRIRNLAEISANGTNGEDSRSALQEEVKARLDEIKRITELNDDFNVKDPTTKASKATNEIEVEADEDTTFDQLGITSTEINIYDKSNSKINTFNLDSSDSIGKLLSILNGSGFSANIRNGVISVTSSDGRYLSGALADELGIKVTSETVVTGTTSSSSNKIFSTTTVLAEETTSFADVGLNFAGKTMEVRTKDTNSLVGTVNINSNTQTFEDLFNSLSAYGVTGTINDGKVTLTSSNNYVTGDIATILGISVNHSSQNTTEGISQTSADSIVYTTTVSVSASNTLADIGIGNTSLVIEKTDGTALKTISVSSTTSLQSLFSTLATNSVTATLTDGVISISGDNIISGALANALGITRDIVSGSATTAGITYTSGTVEVNLTTPVDITEKTSISMQTSGELLKSFNYVDASTCIDITDSSVTSFSSRTTYKITSTEGLVKLSELVNGGEKGSGSTFVLMNDIDLSSIDNWTPIDGFYGTFEGNGYSISNMRITASTDRYVGLFGELGGDVQNLRVLDAKISGVDDFFSTVGILAGYSRAVITNCSVTGNISVIESSYVGGLVGEAGYGTISSSFASGSITGTKYTGGLVGFLGCSISGSYTSGNVTSTNLVSGGLIGFYDEGEINDCKSSASADYGFIGNWNASATNDFFYAKNFKNNVCLSSSAGDVGMTSRTTSYSNGILSGAFYVYSSTPISELGITGDNYITINNSGTIEIITVKSSDTCSSISSDLASYFDGYNDGSVYATGLGWSIIPSATDVYIVGVTDDLKNILKLDAGEGITYEIKDSYLYSNSDSDQLSDIESELNIDTSTKLKDIGISSNQTISVMQNGSRKSVTLTSSDTIADLITKLSNVGITTTLQNGKLTFGASNNSYIDSVSSALASALKITAGKDHTYTVNTETIYSNTQSNNTYKTASTEQITSSSIIGKLAGYSHGSGKIALHRANGSTTTINISSSDSLQDFFDKIKSYGITASVSDGKVTFSSTGDVYLEEINGGSNLLSALDMGAINQTKENVNNNTPSKTLTYMKSLADWTTYSLDTEFGVIAGNPEDKISFNLDFGINYALDISTEQGARLALAELDNMLSTLSGAQSVIGSAQNRFMSVIEDISIQYENLVSSRSTLRDADIAEESSEYIRNQILQQASTTLLATANQTPSIALQLL